MLLCRGGSSGMLLARRAMAPVCRTTSVWREHSALFRPFGSVASPLNLRTYTRAEVASHNNDEDLWVVIDGLVYDLTEWQNFHPGSRQVLMELGGKDASEHFSEVGHSEYARNKMKQFLIGKVDSAPRYSGSEYRSRVGEV